VWLKPYTEQGDRAFKHSDFFVVGGLATIVMAEPGDRKSRRSSFMAVLDAEDYPVLPMMINLCMISASEGLDAALFGSCSESLELNEGLSVGDIGNLLAWQLIPQAVAAPVWGIIASNSYMSRPYILIFGTFFQGLATVLMTINPVFYMFAILRVVNGVCLASLRPIANSIAGDRFPNEVRGKYFGYIMGAMHGGSAVCGYFATKISKQTVFGMIGWKVAFLAVGIFTMACAPIVLFTLKAPPVRPPSTKNANQFDKIMKLFKRWSFSALVFQGMFGLIPWRAMEFRTKYFQSAGLTDDQAGSINLVATASAVIGSMLGGYVGDCFAKCSDIHGRICAAEISVYSGIPVAFFTFYVDPPAGDMARFLYCMFFVSALGLLGTWTPAACNNPVLCSLAEESERSVVISWQVGLEGAIGAVGGILFAYIAVGLGYDTRCARPEKDWPSLGLTPEMCNNRSKLGTAMTICTCTPWFVCGSFYTSLHCSYKRDLESVEAELAEGKHNVELTSS